MDFNTYDKNNNKRILQITATSGHDLYIPPIHSDIFALIFVNSGFLKLKTNTNGYSVEAPAVICLDEQQDIDINYARGLECKVIYFNPSFLNVNLTIDIIRNSSYEELCNEHAFFQLKPFLEENFERRILNLNKENVRQITKSFANCKFQLEKQPDWYWACRARSYFMDIIQCVELLYYDYEIQYDEINTQKEIEKQELTEILSYINSHLDMEISLDIICNEFRTYRKKIEALFKKYLNVTFYEYVKNQRFERICYYLRFTDLKSKEIALRVGISTSQNLCKFFKSMSGKSPNQFRNDAISARKKHSIEFTLENKHNQIIESITA